MDIRLISLLAVGCWLILTIGNLISKQYARATVTGILLIFSTLMIILNTIQGAV